MHAKKCLQQLVFPQGLTRPDPTLLPSPGFFEMVWLHQMVLLNIQEPHECIHQLQVATMFITHFNTKYNILETP